MFRLNSSARFLSLFALALGATQVSAAPEIVQRGSEVFQSQCIRCHASTEMTGRLDANWTNKKADELYQRIKATMPAESPGSRSDAEYLAVTAYVLTLFDVQPPETLAEPAQLASITIARSAAPKPQPALPDVGWTDFNGKLGAQRDWPLGEINATNVAQLQVAWRWAAGMFGPTPEIKNVSSPIVADGMMFATVGVTRNVVAIDPGTGEVRWMWRA